MTQPRPLTLHVVDTAKQTPGNSTSSHAEYSGDMIPPTHNPSLALPLN